jgi:hypothetical protein
MLMSELLTQREKCMKFLHFGLDSKKQDGALLHMKDLRAAFGEAAFKFDDAIVDDAD